MTNSLLPLQRAYLQLLDLARSDAYGGQLQLFALTWLAAARMVVSGGAGVDSGESLADQGTWKKLIDAGFPEEAVERGGISRSHDIGRRAHAASIVAELSRALGSVPWDVLPLVVDPSLKRPYDAELAVLPALATLLLDVVGEPRKGGDLWVPFDGMGQLTVEALRRGWTVRTASPLGMSQLPLELLLIIETGRPEHPNVVRDLVGGSHGSSLRCTHVLAMPPFGMPVRNSRLAHWDTTGAIDTFARTESWAVHEFVNRATRRAVFVVPPGLLFARGQEERLRDYLLHRGGEYSEVEAVIALPAGVFAAAPALAGAIIVVTPGRGNDFIQMVDLGSGRRSVSDAAEIVKKEHEYLLGRGPAPGRRTTVTRDDVSANETSLAPSRYLRRVSDLGESRKLGEFCDVIRPPSPAKEETGFVAYEVGAQDLNTWRPLNGPLEKVVHLRSEPRRDALLRPGDVVVSIKGTVGKAAIVGAAATEQRLVPSQSCIALRIPEKHMPNFSAEYLLMYLRSQHGVAQLEGLQVGTAVQHISPSTLLAASVPVPTQEDYLEVRKDFDQLCQLEDQRAQLEDEMSHIRRRRWLVEV